MKLKRRSETTQREISTAMTARELDTLRRLAADKRVLEVGSYKGASTVVMGEVAATLHSVDPHVPFERDGEKRTMLTQLATNLVAHDLFDKVVIHVGWSWQIVPLFPEHSFDLVFVDADHTRPAVERDLALVRRVVTPDGVLAFHDYGVPGTEKNGRWDTFGVTEVVDSYVVETGARLEAVDTLAVVTLRS